MTKKQEHVFHICKDLEANIHQIPEKSQEEFRNKVLSLSSGYLKKPKHIPQTDRIIAKKIRKTNDFLKNNKDLLVTRADKGNVTVVMRN